MPLSSARCQTCWERHLSSSARLLLLVRLSQHRIEALLAHAARLAALALGEPMSARWARELDSGRRVTLSIGINWGSFRPAPDALFSEKPAGTARTHASRAPPNGAEELSGAWSASFLGLYLDRGSLQQATRRQKRTDVFALDMGGSLIDPASLPHNQRVLLIAVFKGANVASAHPVREGAHSMNPRQVDAAAALMILKIKTHLYDVPSLPVPEWKG